MGLYLIVKQQTTVFKRWWDMKTYEISKDEINGMPYVEGYKAINYDLSTKGRDSFRYGEKGENIISKVFKCDGDINRCRWGLHFSEDPAYVFKFYEPLGYNRYFKIRAYGDVIKSEDGFKSVASIIEFVEEYDMMQYIGKIKKYDRSGSGINYDSGINNGWGINYGRGINNGRGIDKGWGINNGWGINEGWGLLHVQGASECIFCYKKDGIFRRIFNKKVTKDRFIEVYNNILSFGWYPQFNNIFDLKGNLEWWAVCFPELMEYKPKEAWAKMPDEMRQYIQSLPEYDEKIFKAITESE